VVDIAVECEWSWCVPSTGASEPSCWAPHAAAEASRPNDGHFWQSEEQHWIEYHRSCG